MTLRDQLREQAARIEENDRDLRAKEQEEQQFFLEYMAPALRDAAAYFRDVVRDLEIVQPVVRTTYPIGPDADRDVQFDQDQYRIFVDDDAQPREVVINSRCKISATTTRVVRQVREADEFEQFLRDMGITYYRRRQEDTSGQELDISRFIMEGGIQAGFRLSADLEGRRVRVETHNLEDRPVRSYVLSPERLDESFFDALGKVLLREQAQLFMTEVHDEVRQQLRRSVEELQRQRERDLAYGLAEQEEAARQRSYQPLRDEASARLKTLLGQINNNVKDFLGPK